MARFTANKELDLKIAERLAAMAAEGHALAGAVLARPVLVSAAKMAFGPALLSQKPGERRSRKDGRLYAVVSVDLPKIDNAWGFAQVTVYGLVDDSVVMPTDEVYCENFGGYDCPFCAAGNCS